MKKTFAHHAIQDTVKRVSAHCEFFQAAFTTEISRIRFNRIMRERRAREHQQANMFCLIPFCF